MSADIRRAMEMRAGQRIDDRQKHKPPLLVKKGLIILVVLDTPPLLGRIWGVPNPSGDFTPVALLPSKS